MKLKWLTLTCILFIAMAFVVQSGRSVVYGEAPKAEPTKPATAPQKAEPAKPAPAAQKAEPAKPAAQKAEKGKAAKPAEPAPPPEPPKVEAMANVTAPADVKKKKEATIDLAVTSKADGKPLEHSNGTVKITNVKNKQVMKEDTFHTDSGNQAYKYTFLKKGTYTISVQFSPDAALAPIKYDPVSAEKEVKVK